MDQQQVTSGPHKGSPSFRMGLYIVAASAAVVGLTATLINARTAKTYEGLETFSNVLALIQNNYVDEVDESKMLVGAIDGMIQTLDPHSDYMTKGDYQEMKTDTRGEFGGLGIEITMKDGVLTVVAPIDDTPAAKAGIKSGDQIIAVDGKTIESLSLIDAVKILRGPIGTNVTVTIVRPDTKATFDLTLTRGRIEVKSVKDAHLIDDKYAYVRVTQFKERTTDELLDALKSMLAKKPKGLILDLRNNPGGLLDQAVGVADVFLSDGMIVSTNGRIPSAKMEFPAKKDGAEPDLPMIVLVNGGSASASEIVAGALKDQKKALILGTKTFGKGSVQTILQLSDGSALRITTAHYFTPSGTSIQAEGIAPDVVVEAVPGLEAVAFSRERDLKGHLANPSVNGEGGVDEDSTLTPAQRRQKIDELREAAKGVTSTQDVQLDRALDLLRGMDLFGSLYQQSQAQQDPKQPAVAVRQKP